MPFKELDEKTLTDTALYDKFAVYLSQEYQTAKDGFLALGTACNSILQVHKYPWPHPPTSRDFLSTALQANDKYQG